MKCKSLSGKSELTYEVDGDNYRITGNTGNGFYSKEAVSLKAMRAAFKKPFNSQMILSLLKGQSRNTPAFMLAVLFKEGLIQHSVKTSGYYEWKPIKK